MIADSLTTTIGRIFVNIHISVMQHYSYPDKFYPANVGRAVRAFGAKAHTARPTADVLMSGTAAREKNFSGQLYYWAYGKDTLRTLHDWQKFDSQYRL